MSRESLEQDVRADKVRHLGERKYERVEHIHTFITAKATEAAKHCYNQMIAEYGLREFTAGEKPDISLQSIIDLFDETLCEEFWPFIEASKAEDF